MASNLVIVESPAKAKTIQKYLGNDFIVKTSYGHIRDLQDNKLSIAIDNNFEPEYVITDEKKKKVVAELKDLADKAETVWLASDEDREGEAIAWHLAQTLDLDPSKTKRIVFHEITKDAILNAVKNPRNIDLNLVDAQQARRVLDRLVGFELSPVLWRKIQPKLSAGRVQSVTLRLIVDREKEIMAFKNTPYYKVSAEFIPEGSKSAVKALLDTRFDSTDDARKFLEDSIDANFSVYSIESKEGNRFPSSPFTTSTLQQEASRKLHFPVSVTMRVAQSLYERGLITYMRTDSTNLSSLATSTCKKFIEANYGSEYSQPRKFKTKSKGAQEAHEAIRPTFIDNVEINGTAQEQKLYALIWKRTLASQMADAVVLNTGVKVSSDKRSEKFNIQASQVLFDGFLKVYMESSDEENQEEIGTTLPIIAAGCKMKAKSINADCKFTSAPPRYSEATLVKKLEELGIGRPSTYEPTIRTLTTGRGYITKGDVAGRENTVTNLQLKGGNIVVSSKKEIVGSEKNKLLPQEIGMIVTDYLVKHFEGIMDYEFTAKVEKDFDSIADGKKVWNESIGEFYTPFHSKVDEALSNKEFTNVSRELGLAPDGDLLVAKFGQYGPYIQKGDPEKRNFASLEKGQLIESITIEDALKLFELPRFLGEHEGKEIKVLKGRFGPYLKYGDSNVSLPRGVNPLKVTLEESLQIIEAAAQKNSNNGVIAEFKDGSIQVLNGRYGPYIKFSGNNYKIPKGQDAAALTQEDCESIINNSNPTSSGRKTHKKSRKS